MMGTLADGLAELQAAARDPEAIRSGSHARRLVDLAVGLESVALAPMLSNTVVRVCLDRTLAAARACAGVQKSDPVAGSARLAVFEAALYRLAMAADTAPPDEGVLSRLPDYDRRDVANPVSRTG